MPKKVQMPMATGKMPMYMKDMQNAMGAVMKPAKKKKKAKKKSK